MRPSPFSPLCNYTLHSYPCYPRPPGNLTAWEHDILDFLSHTGAAAYFQITTGSKQKHKLNTLNRAGLIYKYKLIGEYKLNIAASRPYNDIREILKSLVFAQLVIKLKNLDPNLQIFPGTFPVHAEIIFNSKTFPIIVTRAGDNLSILPSMVSNLDRVIIISETFDLTFNKIHIPARIALDKDLINSPSMFFHLPDGRNECVQI
ncbi:MAG: hypothetical protein PHT79_09785 [Syntrophomonadaceae bacterium]|nr:hypothetical protein [Syntrophomonadaceae bacterium]MDD4550032.1 hypothetical protein [Syntrophomonadaceae bacterium]